MTRTTNEIYWLTAARQVAEHFGFSVRTVDRTESGILRSYGIGSVRRIKANDVVKLPRRSAAAP